METFACYLIGIDLYGDEIIEKFINEDSDYLSNICGNDYTDMFIRHYKSNEKILIEEKDYYKTSCIFLIGVNYNNKCENFNNTYDLNIIKVFKNKSDKDGKGVFYTDRYENVLSFLRAFTLTLAVTSFMYDNFIDMPNQNTIDFFRFNNYKMISYRLKENEKEWKKVIEFFDTKLDKKSTKWYLRIIVNNSQNQIMLCEAISIAECIVSKLGDFCDYNISGWNKPYQEIELIYEE